MSVQMKYDLAYALTIMLTILTFSEEDCKPVPKVDCGAKKLQQKYLPVIVNANSCFEN